jgi:hypothetical protein
MIEADELDKIRRVIAHNGGEIIEEDSPWQSLTISPWEKKALRRFIAGWTVL